MRVGVVKISDYKNGGQDPVIETLDIPYIKCSVLICNPFRKYVTPI